MFDDFMDELRRREAARAGADGQPKTGSDEAADGEPKTAADEAASEQPKAAADEAVSSGPSNEGSREDDVMRSDGSDSDDTDRDEDARDRARSSGGAAPAGARRRYSGGPPGEFPEFHIGRGWIVLGVVVLAMLRPPVRLRVDRRAGD